MGRLSQELIDAITNKELIFTVVELDIGGTTYGYSGQWVASNSFGMYKAQVIEGGFGDIKQAVSLELGGLQGSGTSVTIHDDTDLTLHKMMEGEYGRTMKGSDARVKIVSPAIAADKFYTAFAGEIHSVAQSQPRVWTFAIKPKDKPLRGVVRTPIISTTDWPNAHGDAVGLRVPIVFGHHLSTGTVATGMVPTLYVDTVGFRYLISAGNLKVITGVYIDGVKTAAAGVWAGGSSPSVNGRTYHWIDFISDQVDAVITVDVDGVTDTGLAGGTMEANPANQLKMLLVNWVFGEYQDGVWLADSTAPIDTDSFSRTAAFFDIHNITGSRVIAGGAQTGATINEWSKTFQCAVYWTNEGKIGVAPDPYCLDDIYFASPWLTEEHCISDPKFKYSTQLLKDEVQANFLYSTADKKPFDSVRVKDTLRGWDVAESIDLNWGIASII